MSITPPQTRQFQSFKNNLEYARNMIKAGDSLQGLQPSAVDIEDLYRAAWVQAVSAVDHWLHEELFRRVEALAADPETKLPKQLSNFELPLSVIEAIRREERTTADAVLEHVQAKWAYLPLHNPRKISEAYRLVTDVDLWQTAAERMNEWSHHRTSYNGQKIKKRFSAIVERRNKIAHYADLEDGDLQRRRPITSGEATDALDWLERIVLAIAKGLD